MAQEGMPRSAAGPQGFVFPAADRGPFVFGSVFSFHVPAQRPGGVVRLESFVAGTGECADADDLVRLRAGTSLRLRREAGPRGAPPRLVVAMPDGRPLGWLPREDAEALEAAGADPAEARVSVAALVPAYRRSRVQVEIQAPARASRDSALRPAGDGPEVPHPGSPEPGR